MEEKQTTETAKKFLNRNYMSDHLDGHGYDEENVIDAMKDYADLVLNDILNGMNTGKYKFQKDSNSIAQFVIDYLKEK